MKSIFIFVFKWSVRLFVFLLLFLSALFLWLREYPPSLNFSKPYINSYLSKFKADHKISFDGVKMRWPGIKVIPGISIVNLRYESENTNVSCREFFLNFSPAALLNGKIEPESIIIDEPVLSVFPGLTDQKKRQKPSGTEKKIIEPIPDTEAKISAAYFSGIDKIIKMVPFFKKAHIKNGKFILKRKNLTGILKIPSGTMEVDHDKYNFIYKVSLNYGFNEETSSIQAFIYRLKKNGPVKNEIDFTNIHPDSLIKIFPEASILKDLKFPLNGKVYITFSPDRKILINRFSLLSSGGSFFYKYLWKQPVNFKKFKVDGRITDFFSRVNFENFILDFGNPVFIGKGHIGDLKNFNEMSFDVDIKNLEITKSHRLWPYRFASEARWWIKTHFKGGIIKNARFRLRLTPDDLKRKILPAHVIEATVPFEDVKLDYFRPLAIVTHTKGVAKFSAHDIKMYVDHGKVYNSLVKKGSVIISGLCDYIPKIDIKADVKGPANDLNLAVMALSGTEKSRFKITSGQAQTHLEFKFPLDNFTDDKFNYKAVSQMENLKILEQNGFVWNQGKLSAELINDFLKINGTDGNISHPEIYEKKIPIPEFKGKAKLLYYDSGVRIKNFSAKIKDARINLSGLVKFPNDYPFIDLAVSADNLYIQRAKFLWPKGVADEARKWVKEHITEGFINGAKVRLNLIPQDFKAKKMPKTSIEAMVPFKGVKGDYFPPFPMLKEGQGKAVFFSDSMRIDMTHGKIAGSIVDYAKIKISGFDDKTPNISLDAKIKGPAKDLIDADKTVFGNYPDSIYFTGDAATSIILTSPLSKDQFYKNIIFSVSTNVKNIKSHDFFGKKISDGFLAFGIDSKKGIKGKGWLKTGKTRIDIYDISQKILVGEKVKTANKLNLSLNIPMNNPEDLGIGPIKNIKGNIKAAASLEIFQDKVKADIFLDLYKTDINFKKFGLFKPGGRKALLSCKGMVFTKNEINIPGFEVAGKDMRISGLGRIQTASPDFFDIRLGKVKFGKNDFALNLNFKNRDCSLDIKGKSLDISPLILGFGNEGSKKSELSKENYTAQGDKNDLKIVMTAGLDKLFLAKDQSMEKVSASLTLKSSRVLSANLKGVFDNKKSFIFEFMPSENKSVFSLKSEDAGKFLNGLGLPSKFKNGALYIKEGEYRFFKKGYPDIKAKLKMKDFTVLEAPQLAKLLSAASFVGLLEQMKTGGINFSDLDADLKYKNGILRVENGSIQGLAMGAVFDGNFDTKQYILDFKGIIAPFNIINKIINIIPVLGNMIVGDGIIAARFDIKGSYEKAKVHIVPLSTLAIGSLKKLFPAAANKEAKKK